MSEQMTASHWIGGEWTDSNSKTSETINPATGEVVGSYADGDAANCQAAIDAAKKAFEETSWATDTMHRATVLNHLADAYEANMGKIVHTITTENGKLAGEAGFEAHFLPRGLRFAAGLALTTQGRVADATPGRQSMSIRQPVGVVGVITPWNSPAYLSIRSIAPALAAGCTVVVKFPGQAAQSARVLAEIFSSVEGLPAGVMNVITESGSEGAKLLVDSLDVPVISYTGSTATGRMIAAAAAKNLKRVGLELGGKTPHLVFDDANLDLAVPTIVASSTVFCGQFCMTGSRIIAQKGIAEELKKRLAEALSAVQPGPASDESSQMGPLIDKNQVTSVDAAVNKAIEEGAEVIVRGGPITEGDLAKSAFYKPTLLGVPSSAVDREIIQAETFGPVQTFMTFDTEEEGIKLANETEFGLSACVWSQDVNTPIRVARKLHSGLISINSWANLAVEFEEGGWKASGTGRLGGYACMDEFLEYKQIAQDYSA